jgi:hypothetical protein
LIPQDTAQAVAAQGFDHPMNLRELVASRFGPDGVDGCYGNLSKNLENTTKSPKNWEHMSVFICCKCSKKMMRILSQHT